MKLFLLLIALSFASYADETTCRSQTQKHHFDKQQGYPHGRRGFVVDHVCPLECGGIDNPINMSYQTFIEGHKKDRWERTDFGCKSLCNDKNSTPKREVFNCKIKKHL